MSSPRWMLDAGRQEYYYWDHYEGCYVYQHGERIYTRRSDLKDQPVLGNIEVGPAEQITEPQALLSGIRAHKKVRETLGERERLDPRYQKHYPGRDFYRVGKVFKVLWPEPAGSPQSGVTFVTGAYGEQFYYKIRWFLVIREGKDSCTCLSIQTYNRKGVEKQGVIKAEHSVIYSQTNYPTQAIQDDPNGEMLQPAIPVVPASREQSKMDPMCRLNYAKLYTVEHNVKSLHFGDVPQAYLPHLLYNFATVLLSPLVRDHKFLFYLSNCGNKDNLPTSHPDMGIAQSRPTTPPDQRESPDSGEDPPKTPQVAYNHATQTLEDEQASNSSMTNRSEDPYDGSTARPYYMHNELARLNSYEDLPQPSMKEPSYQVFEGDNYAGRVQSDSECHSGNGTITASVCSIRSSGRSLGIPTDDLQNFIGMFTDGLMKKAGVHVWAEYAVTQHPPGVFENHVQNLLRRYAINLEDHISSKQESDHPIADRKSRSEFDRRIAKGAIRLIRRYRLEIARHFREHAMSPYEPDSSALTRPQEYSKQLSLHEKVDLLEKPAEFDPSEKADDFGLLEDNDFDEGDEEEDTVDLAAAQEFMLCGNPFRDLMIAMRRALYCDDRAKMHHIEEIVRKEILQVGPEIVREIPQATVKGVKTTHHPRSGVAKPQFRTEISVDWDPIQFLESQYGDRETPLASILVLSGSALYAHGTTCADYIRMFWPSTSHVLLPQIQKALREPSSTLHLEDHGCITIEFQSGSCDGIALRSLKIKIHAAAELIVEVAQQMSWLASALREGPPGSTVSYSESTITPESSHEQEIPTFRISVTHQPLHPVEDTCWLPLFSNAVIAHKFPIPDRADESGLEIPVEIMTALAGMRHAVEYGEGVLLKGFSTMLVPTKRTENTVQWHLLRRDDLQYLAYEDGLRQCSGRVLADQVSLDDLRTTTMIVGWCSSAQLFFGSELINYDNIHYSGAEDMDSHLKFVGGAIGFSQFGVGQLNVNFGAKDGKYHFQGNNGPYVEVLSRADDMRVTLYDNVEKRGWLVPASNVILHIAQARLRTGFLGASNDSHLKLFSKDTSECTARESLLRDSSKMILEGYRVKDMILDIWSLLDSLLARKLLKDAAPGIEPRCTMQEILYGFEFQDVIRKRSPFSLKCCRIAKTSGGWIDLIRDIDALVFFANGFEDLIKPSQGCQNLCHSWRSLPKGNDYLAVPVKMLKNLYNVAGCPLDRKFLTCSHLQWHLGASVFGPCNAVASYHCRCDRLSQVVGKHALGTITGPGNLDPYEEGSVVFGQSGSLLNNFDPQKQTDNRGLYSQENKPIGLSFDPNHSEPFDSSASDMESSVQRSNGSEETECSSSSSLPSHDHVFLQSQAHGLEKIWELEQASPGEVHGQTADRISCSPHGSQYDTSFKTPEVATQRTALIGKSQLGPSIFSPTEKNSLALSTSSLNGPDRLPLKRRKGQADLKPEHTVSRKNM